MENLSTILIIVAVAIAVYFLYRFLAPYFVRVTHIFYVSGSPGTGKDVLSSNYALKRYSLGVRRWRLDKFKHNFKQRFVKKELRVQFNDPKPILYSSAPLLIRYSSKPEKRQISKQLTLDIMLLKKRMPKYSVIYISDLNRFVNQWSYKNLNVQENIAEFISEFRHYTKGGYFIANSQSSSQVAKEIRSTFGKVRNNLSFKRILCFYRIEGRTITMSEDVLNVESGDADNKETNVSYIYGFLNPFVRRYDTYAYYGRVTEMDFDYSEFYKTANTNYFFDLPTKKVNPNTINTIKDYKSHFKFDKLTAFYYFIGTFILAIIVSLITPTAFLIPFALYLILLFDAFS